MRNIRWATASIEREWGSESPVFANVDYILFFSGTTEMVVSGGVVEKPRGLNLSFREREGVV